MGRGLLAAHPLQTTPARLNSLSSTCLSPPKWTAWICYAALLPIFRYRGRVEVDGQDRSPELGLLELLQSGGQQAGRARHVGTAGPARFCGQRCHFRVAN